MVDDEDDDGADPQDPIVVPLSDELDLHSFLPREVGSIVEGWIDECAEAGFPRVRLVHGKGIGALRETVRAVLSRHPRVASFGPDGGNWGATIAILKP